MTLAPWPNRIVDGRYSFDGRTLQLPITEPARGQALHGLVFWAEFADVVVSDDRVVLGAIIQPQAGYPFRVEVEVEYRVDTDGLHQTVTGRNVGEDAAPWGTGPHPYLVAGKEGSVDAWMLHLPASSVLTVTPDRLSPVALETVEDHLGWDFRTPRRIADTFIDHAFTDLARDGEGQARVELRSAEGSGVAMVWGPECPWVQIHTADTKDAATNRIGLAVEPMTCAPDAFNSGDGLITLQQGDAHAASWSIVAL